MDYNAANEFLKTRLSLPTELSSRGISESLPPAIRAHCFFSARVAEARVLEKLREVSDQYSAGKLSLSEARKLLAKYLDFNGIGDPQSARISNIASCMRLNLVLRQNAAMAAAVGRYQVSRDPDIEKRWPCWRYITGPNSRDSHATLDGKVIRKDDPFWHSHYPPWDFNCNCDVEDSDGQPDRTPPYDDHAPESGFQFDPAHAFEEFDISSSLAEMSRSSILKQAENAVRDQKLGSVGLIVAPAEKGVKNIPVSGIKKVENSFEAMKDAAKEELKNAGLDPEHLPDYQTVNRVIKDKLGKPGENIPGKVLDKFPKEPFEVTKLCRRVTEAAGLPPDIPLMLGKGNSHQGIEHLWRHHKDLFVDPQKAVRLLQETLGNENCRVVVSLKRNIETKLLHGSKVREPSCLKRIVLHNPQKKTYCVMVYDGKELKLVSWHNANEDYGNKEWSLG